MSESVLYVVSTPIGNLGDMTPRAVEVLGSVDIIAAEDTRYSKRLLSHFGINVRLISCHEHNERYQTAKIIERLHHGESVALISDAGTPLISDPGYYLVRKVREAGINVIAVPGACAIIAALSISGLATDRFYFEGFLPAKASRRKKKLDELSDMLCTWGFYESTHRIRDSIDDCLEVLGANRYIVLVREITKKFETVLAGSIEQVQNILQNDAAQCKGEFVVLVEGNKSISSSLICSNAKTLLAHLLKELPIKKAVAIVADMYGHQKKELYNLALTLKQG
ncbi:MAG: 16S rRNA (cytidine(1402)-2'-O)-methyltransferase [Endozoicomonas sp. (ex Botrylloides leachii)]|nr:16S rRNA (cytidine(1402)-2'-O)-methyltransferase [Endozoicomonas sp. (ex Botrylloides leachii)]